MNENEASRSGACYCGTIRFRVAGPYQSACICHCRSCQRASGAPLVAWITVPGDAFRLEQGVPAEISTPAGAHRSFCRDCGTSLTYRHDDRPGVIDICLAALDDAAAIEPASHIWMADKMPWLHLDDGLPAYEEWGTGSS